MWWTQINREQGKAYLKEAEWEEVLYSVKSIRGRAYTLIYRVQRNVGEHKGPRVQVHITLKVATKVGRLAFVGLGTGYKS